MKKITVTIHNGVIKTQAEGFKGGACLAPLEKLTEALQATKIAEEITAEGCLPEEYAETTNAETQAV